MKLALIGYGKMGKEIERQALARGDTIVSISDVDSLPTAEGLALAEVAIDFSVPGAVVHNLELGANIGVDMVVGTTGWYDHLPQVRKWFSTSALVYAENFSIGVNLFYRIVREAARVVGRFEDYDAYVAEEHHRHKLDSPSGTALRLGKILAETLPPGERNIQISSLRAGSIAGVHRVGFDSPADTIELRHTARSRAGFALGALAAAHWVRGRRGVFTMDDVEL